LLPPRSEFASNNLLSIVIIELNNNNVISITPNSVRPNIEAFIVYKKLSLISYPVTLLINQVTRPLSDSINCHENALIVKLVQNGATRINNAKVLNFFFTTKQIKYASGKAKITENEITKKDSFKVLKKES